MKIRLLLITAPLALALTACGGGQPTTAGVASADGGTTAAKPSASSSASGGPTDQREAQLKFAQCMREHGVDMKDPEPGGGIRIEAKGDQNVTEKAMKACQPLMDNVVGERVKQDPGAQDKVLKYAQCMRENGIAMEDPKDGKFMVQVPQGQEKQMEKAQKACKEFQPNFGGGQ
ncbi:hypothetical protein ACIBG8_13920 [Nonomuraea sp. NPDC050556]|uniref:hypothetical protein n=1 Tax=Nonomuraea sp. NPDC050556 TaxID=3364369 RepID=UPI00379E8FD0